MPIDDSDVIDWMIQEARKLGGSRVIRDEQALTVELANVVFERLEQYQERTGKSAAQVARSMGIRSESTLSEVKNKGLAAPAGEKHIRAIDKWLEVQIANEVGPKTPGFVKTRVAEAINAAIRMVIKTSSIGLIHAPSGCGKTMTAQAIRAEIPGTVYLSIDSSGRSARAVMEGLAAELRMTGLRLSTAQLFKHVCDILKDTGRLIIIDEISKLAGRANDDALHVLRDLHDHTGCPMVWVGNGKIATYIRDNLSDGFDPLDQVASRISLWLDLAEAAERDDGGGSQLCTVADIQRVFAAQKIRLTPDASRYLAQLASDPAFGCLRAAKHLVAMAMLVANGAPITEEMLRDIQRDRLGRRVAEAVEVRLNSRMKASA